MSTAETLAERQYAEQVMSTAEALAKRRAESKR